MIPSKAFGGAKILGLEFFPRQWEAVAAPIGPLMVIAGPGSGKTRCLIGRVGYLIEALGADPSKICAITFTNKAAGEIRSRLRQVLGNTVEELTLGTIHSLCLNILRECESYSGLARGFGVADDVHQKMILRRLRVHDKRHGQILGLMGRRRLQGYSLTDGDETIFQNYINELQSHNLIDYDGILSHTRQVLENNEPVLRTQQCRWHHILIDEFQDLDPSQYEILKLLAWTHRSVFSVGDDDQSIFTWRSADPKVLKNFMRDFEISAPVVLDVNCRCSKNIFQSARKILPFNDLGFEKQIEAVRNSPFPVMVKESPDEFEEAKWLAQDIKEDQHAHGLQWGDYSILYRTHKDGEAIEQALMEAGIPCQLSRGHALTDETMIDQLITSLRVVIAPDSELEIERFARTILDDLLLTEIMSSSGDTLLSKAKEYAKRAGKTNGPKVWKFVYQTENLKMLKHGQMSLQAVIDTILSQGIGRTESALEKRHEELSDPMACPFTSRLAARLLEAESKSVTVHVTACGGLEFVVFRMLRRAMPTLNAVYHGSEVYEENGIDFDLAPSRPDKDSHSLGFAENNGPKAIQLFRALQCVDSMRSGRMFGEYVCFDTETTGKDTDHCEIIELAAVKVNNGQIVDSFHSLINVNHPISPGASQVHGYYDEDLVGKPKMREVWPQFRQFVGNTGVVVHNGIKFDIPLVERLTWGFGGIIGMYFFDTLPLARSLVKTGGIRLVDLASLYGVDTGRSHRALDDSRCLAEVFEKLLHEWGARSRKTSLSNLLDLVGLGVAIENIEPVTDEEKLLVDLGNWKAMGPRSTALKDYEQELENGEIAGPCSSTLFERMGGRELYDRARTEKSNADRYPESYSRLTSIVSSITKPDLESAIRELLDVLALSRSDGAGIAPDRVNLLTHHSTKGLEFSRVYIVGLEDDMRAMQSGDPGALAEARRLLYVAMTRAKDRLFLTYCKKRNNRDLQGTTFLEEMGLVAQERNLPSSENWQDW